MRDARPRPRGGARKSGCGIPHALAVLEQPAVWAGGILPIRTTPLCRLLVNLLALVLSAALASGCSSMRPLPPSPGGFQESIRPGDKVRVVRHDGTEVQLTVTAVTSDALVGEPPHGLLQESHRVTVRFSDIARIERSEFSAGKTAGAGVAAVVGVGLALGLAVGILAIWALTRVPGGLDAPARGAVPESPRR